jgi:hypothetical protein
MPATRRMPMECTSELAAEAHRLQPLEADMPLDKQSASIALCSKGLQGNFGGGGRGSTLAGMTACPALAAPWETTRSCPAARRSVVRGEAELRAAHSSKTCLLSLFARHLSEKLDFCPGVQLQYFLQGGEPQGSFFQWSPYPGTCLFLGRRCGQLLGGSRTVLPSISARSWSSLHVRMVLLGLGVSFSQLGKPQRKERERLSQPR